MDTALLKIALQTAVPLRIAELRAMTEAGRERTRMEWAANAVEPISSHGDDLQFGSKRAGAAASVFNHLARALAAGAFQPGGISFSGLHFEETG